MAIGATAVWEVRTTGSDAQGGFYTSGGTDYSQQDAAQLSLADVVTNGTTTVTSVTGGFTAAMIGNGFNIAGTIYQITARTDTNTVTIDRTAGAASGQVGKVGGALATPSKAIGSAVGSNQIWIKQGAYTVSANPTLGFAGVTPLSGSNPTRISGYGVARGDSPSGATRPTLTASGTTTTILPINVSGVWVESLILDCNSLTGSSGLVQSGNWSGARRLWIKNFKLYGAQVTGNSCFFRDSEISGGVTGATAAITTTTDTQIVGNYVHDNVCPGIVDTIGGVGTLILNNIVANNTGASSDGIQVNYNVTIFGNTVYGNGRDGIRNTANFNISYLIQRNVLVNNGGYGLNFSGGLVIAAPEYDNNAYYNNTSGTRNNCGSGSSDVILTASPFTNAGSGDFSLNATAGGGAASRAAGIPGAFPGGLTTGYPDIGAVQSQAAAAAGLIRVGFEGGIAA